MCKDCMQVLAEDAFELRATVPDDLKHLHYCQGCFGTHVAPALESYRETLSRAEAMYFFFATQKNRLPVLSKAKWPVKVEQQVDRNETILRLAFISAEAGYNSIIEASVDHEKVRNEGYQKTVWKGQGVPANVDSGKLERNAGRDF